MLDRENFVPLWKKYALTVNEAKSYFNIGDKTLRRLIDDNVCADFVLQNGNKYLIKREKFESFLNNSYSI